jgi:uncharacterized membrane protein YedE/YeeE
MLPMILIGAGLGFILEAGGLGNPRKLTGVFFLKDWTVPQVMATAIVVSMGAVLILTVGGVDTTRYFTPPTMYLAQVIGGLIFGLGFFIGGYCPGTSMVGLGSGRLDALPFIGGMVGGYYVWDLIREHVRGVFNRVGRNVDTLPEILGIDHRLLAAIFFVVGGSIVTWLWWRTQKPKEEPA